MHLRPLRSFAALGFASALFFGILPSASAGPKDKAAQKLFDTAINEDYLNADFDKAEKKLKEAITACGSSGCSSDLLAKIHVALGTVYGVGQNKSSEAKDEFVVALKADSGAALDPSLTTPELTKIFADAKKAAGGSSGSAPPPTPTKAPAGDATHTPPPESQVNTPLPIYVEPSDDVPLSKVTVRYKPFGATQFKSIELKKMGKGYGGEIPCEDTTTTGDIKYFFAFTGADGEPAGGLGSSKEPFKTTIKNELEGEAPKLPGKKAATQCKERGDCPPDMPGCDSGKPVKHGEKAWGSSCELASECKEGLTCLNGICAEDAGDNKDKPEGPKKRMNLIGVSAQFDFLVISGSKTVCDGNGTTNYDCFIQGTQHQFAGVPIAFPNTDGIQGGGGLAGARLLVGYDRQILKKIGLTVGARIGYAFGGPKAPDNLDGNGNLPLLTNPAAIMINGINNPPPNDPRVAPQVPAKSFFAFHGELRLSYYLLNSMLEDKKFRPFVFIDGGIASANASVPVAICDSNVVTGDTGKGCGLKTATVIRQVTAYQITGLNFFGFGAGTTFGITPLFGISAELKFMFMFPQFGTVVAPSIGPVFAF